MIRGRHQRTGRPVRAHPTRPSSCTNAAAQSWALRPRHQMQITFAGSATKLRGLLQQMSEAGLLETTTADAASAGACAAAAAAPDSGCEPNIMTRAQADACQLYYRPLKEGELNIMTIEGHATSCFIGRTDPDPPACSCPGQGIKEEESTTDRGSGTASSTQPVLHFCSSAPAEDVLCSMPAPQKATFEYVDNSSCIKHAAAPEAPYHKHGTLHYRLGSIHHSARNFFGYRSTIKVLAWTVTSELGKLYTAAGAQQAPFPPTATSASILDAYTPDGEKEVADLNSRWETDAEHCWIYGNHPDMTPAQKEQLKQLLIEEKGAFAYSLEDLGATWRSKIDCRSGFFNIPLTEESKQQCAFWWEDGIQPDQAKVAAMQALPRPTSADQTGQ
ncbi:hypothetical protein OEZ85_009624 [Tetradesmus obliquus]|uniref:Uncharacterized protein n=1 Tax=Tetradesmus obliquus TaxID=3088 RepID=A0ABY8U9M4_TETOB|nr:hypothetical protein OEZ85_009624 [Tetradesmus obliquus]